MPARKSRRERLDHTITIIQQRHGPQAIRQGVSASAAIPHISTSFPQLDSALGIGGIPRGRVTVLTGAPTSGAFTLSALILAQAQGRAKHSVAYIDLWDTCDADYLERCGVHLDHLLVARPADSRQALDMALHLADRHELAAVLFDAWPALAADAATRQYAAATLDQLIPRLARSQVAFVVLDQPLDWRARLTGWTDPAHSALAHHAAVRLAFRRESWHTRGPDIRGYRAEVTIEKNKLGPERKSVTLDILFNGTVRGDGI